MLTLLDKQPPHYYFTHEEKVESLGFTFKLYFFKNQGDTLDGVFAF